jgi:hypothetical protein
MLAAAATTSRHVRLKSGEIPAHGGQFPARRLVADHSSVIIGRRRVGDTCQYRVQDNTGEYCAPMREGIRDRCELGRIWLTEDELKRTLYSVTYLR